MGAEWPLVGRAGELAEVGALIRRGEVAGAVLVGPAGVGKTRLGTECLRVAQEYGSEVGRVTATRSASRLPLGALLHLLPTSPEPMPVTDPRLLRHLSDHLAKAAGAGRFVLLVDDAHLLDEASAALLLELALDGSTFVLATMRAGEPVPDAMQALWRDGITARLDIEPLSAADIHQALLTALGAPLDPTTAQTLAAHAAGNMLYLRELVRGAEATGSLALSGDRWTLRGPLKPSSRLIELVESQLAGLGARQRDLLEHLAWGESLSPAELNRLADPELISGLADSSLLSSSGEGQRIAVRLSHPVYADVMQAQLAAHRRPRVLDGLADAVAATGDPEDTVRVAMWRLEAGSADADLLTSAAGVVRERGDLALTERLARAAVEAGGGFPCALLAAQMTSLQGRGAEAESELAQLAELAADDDQRGTIAITRLDNFAFFQGQSEAGLLVADEAESVIADVGWRTELAGRRSSLLLGIRGPRAAAEVAEPLLGKATGRGLAWAAQVACYSFGRLGRFEAALDAAQRGRTAHMALAQPMEWYLHLHVNFRCDALAHAGRLEEAEELAATHYRQGVAEGSPDAQAFFGWQLAKMVGDRGDVDAAIREGRTAVSLFRELGRPLFAREAMLALALALALGKRTREAADILASLDSLAPARYYMGVDLLCTRAWVAASEGDRRNARAHLDEATRLGEEIGDLVGEATALHTIARLGQPDDVVERLAHLAERVEGSLIPARAEHAAALATEDETRLAAVTKQFEAMGASLLAAEAAASVAAVCKTKGASRRAATAARLASQYATRCRGARTPGLRIPDPQTTITPAEQRIARLAAAGQPNRVVAETLSLSVRTVENHLQRVYMKLGVTGRDQLREALEAAV